MYAKTRFGIRKEVPTIPDTFFNVAMVTTGNDYFIPKGTSNIDKIVSSDQSEKTVPRCQEIVPRYVNTVMKNLRTVSSYLRTVTRYLKVMGGEKNRERKEKKSKSEKRD